MNNDYTNIGHFWEMARWEWDKTTHFHVIIEEGYYELEDPETNSWEPVATGCIIVKPIMTCWGKGV